MLFRSPFVPTWGPEWEYVDRGGRVLQFKRRLKFSVTPAIALTSTDEGDWNYNEDGSFWGARSPYHRDIVSQRPCTPAPVEPPAPSQPADVPQWCRDAAREWLSKLVCFSDKNDLIQMLGRHIARHANTNKTEEISPLVSLANVVEREKKDVGTNDRLLDFSNLEALIQGCVSGRVSEWPFLKTEAYRALQLIKNQSAEIERLKAACSAQQNEIQQIIGKALGYPRYCDDQANFPNATEADGVCVGEHVAESLASEAAAQIASLRERLAGVEDERDRAQSACCELRQAFKSSVDGKRSLYDMMEYEVDRVGSSLGPLQDGSWRKVILACWPYIEAANSTTCGDETWRKLKDLTARLSAAEAERDEARAAHATVLEHCRALRSRLREFQHHVDDEKHPVVTALRADLARAKDALINIGSFFGCSAHLPWFSDDACDEVSAMIDEKGGEKRYDPAFYETYCAQVIADIVTGALSASASGEEADNAELR